MRRDQAIRAYRQGRFNDVLNLLASITTREYEERILRAEALYHRGYGQKAAEEATAVLKESSDPSVRSRCLSIVGAQLWDEGDLTRAISISKDAFSVAEQSEQPGLITRSAAQLLERTCDAVVF